MLMKNSLIVTCLLSALLALAGCEPAQETQVVEEKPRMVRVEKIVRRDLPIYVDVVGRLIPNREVVVSSQVAGILMRYNVVVGSAVKAGDPLVELDPADYRLALKQAGANLLSAQARLAAAQNSYRRARNLLPGNAITPELFDQAEAEYKASQALVTQLETAVGIAQRRLDKTLIRAPFDGYVAQRMVELGQNMAVGEPVMAMADLKTMRVRIHLNERDYVRLDKDDPVTVKVEAFPDSTFDGWVDKVGIKADPQTNTFEVDLLLDNPGILLKAGLTARVSINTDMLRDSIMIAQSCVIFREKGKEVFVVDADNRVTARKVELGQVDGSSVQIIDGLVAGDNLVITGAPYLKTGDKVKIAP